MDLSHMILLPHTVNLSIEQVVVEDTLSVTLRSELFTAVCPFCGQAAKRVHSRYQRHPDDLPISGRSVRLVIEVRRFFCDNACCPRKTFAEQLPTFVRPHAQRTVRLQLTLQQLGLALGGEAGAQLGKHMGLRTSPDSLLRLVRQAEQPHKEPAKIIGIDDWAYKRRLRYGTLICDLERNTPIDVLPDRSVQTVCTWLEQHPEVEIICRDRWSEYATAAQKGAPQAIQVADRWHLLHNLVEELTHLLARHRSQVRQQTMSDLHDTPQAVSAPVAQRQDQYTQIQALHRLGLAPAHIARRVGLSERTIYRWLARQAAPHGRHHARGASVIDPYKAYLLKRWQEGCRKGSLLCQELKAQGYRGSERAVYRYLSFLQETYLFAEQATSTAPEWETFSAKQAVWLLIRQPEGLDEQQRQALVGLCQVNPEIEKAYQLAQSFCSMLRQRQGEKRLEGWLQEAKKSALPELQQFAAGIQRDKAAVQNGLSLPYSTGPVEGHINRLKLIKRSMYGRAQFDLLRQRVLQAS
jgi:transposase